MIQGDIFENLVVFKGLGIYSTGLSMVVLLSLLFLFYTIGFTCTEVSKIYST